MTKKEEIILEFMKDPEYKPMKAKEIAIILGVPKKEYPKFQEAIAELEKEFKIGKNHKNKYKVIEEEYKEGNFRKNAKGFGFVNIGEEDEIYISKDKSKNALNEDKVLIEIIEEKSENKKAELAQQTEALMAELNVISGGREEFTAKRIEIAARQEKAALELAQAQKALEEAEKKRNQAALESVKQNAEYEHVLQQLESDYGLTLEEAHKEALLEAGDNSLRRQELSLQRRIEELGPVNAAAIEQYAAVKERFEFLQKQYDDLAGAKANLESVISEINSGMSKRFKEAFAKINVYFSECYVKLFGGGTAYLKLTDPGDVLSSGIDIEVQPPGKKLQSLYLLSGGERALTVIALLFALLSYSPAPFCILDEIDAALDEANVDRFARFLTAYAENNQFIVITHRKGTMEAANVLHGVTMEESGVSKLLSVKLT